MAGVVPLAAIAASTNRAGAALRENGQTCRRGSQCGSGWCKGAKGRKKCRPAPSQGICTIESNAGALGPIRTDCQGAASSDRCLCWVTTAGRSFCGEAAPATCGCGANNGCASAPGAVCVEARQCGLVAAPTACVRPCPAPA